jgi:hypothetical protein
MELKREPGEVEILNEGTAEAVNESKKYA